MCCIDLSMFVIVIECVFFFCKLFVIVEFVIFKVDVKVKVFKVEGKNVILYVVGEFDFVMLQFIVDVVVEVLVDLVSY